MSEERKATEAAEVPEDLPKYPRSAFGLDERPGENYTSYETALKHISGLQERIAQLRETNHVLNRRVGALEKCVSTQSEKGAFRSYFFTAMQLYKEAHDENAVLKARAEKAEAKVERRGAPLSDEEWLGLCSGDHVQIADVQRHEIDAVIAARAAEPGKEDKGDGAAKNL